MIFDNWEVKFSRIDDIVNFPDFGPLRGVSITVEMKNNVYSSLVCYLRVQTSVGAVLRICSRECFLGSVVHFLCSNNSGALRTVLRYPGDTKKSG